MRWISISETEPITAPRLRDNSNSMNQPKNDAQPNRLSPIRCLQIGEVDNLIIGNHIKIDTT